jgi:hypothetical protein
MEWDNNEKHLLNELRTIIFLVFAYVNIKYNSSRFAYHGTTSVTHTKTWKVIGLVTKTRIDVALEDVGTKSIPIVG